MTNLKKAIFLTTIIISTLWALKFTSPNLKIEGYSGLICEIIWPGDDTKYAQGYSHEKFLSIKIGMTEKEVINILGEPLMRWEPEKQLLGLQYSDTPSSWNYHLRQVYLKDGFVKEVIGYFYID
jgi:hypothetical protein